MLGVGDSLEGKFDADGGDSTSCARRSWLPAAGERAWWKASPLRRVIGSSVSSLIRCERMRALL
jgi:hypothetical protein